MVKTKEGKKTWIKILAPKEFNNKILGETLQVESKKLIGRGVNINLSSLTGDFKKQGTSLGFKINEIKDGQAITEVYKYIISPSHLRRLVRKAKDKIDDSLVVETKDKVKVKIKPFMISRHKTSRSRLTDLRKNSREFLINFSKNVDFLDLIREIVSGKLQNNLKHELKKIYPLSLYEVRHVERVK